MESGGDDELGLRWHVVSCSVDDGDSSGVEFGFGKVLGNYSDFLGLSNFTLWEGGPLCPVDSISRSSDLPICIPFTFLMDLSV